MKPWVRLVLIVVIVVALYAATLVFGVSSKSSGGEKASANESSWITSLGSVTARFAPKLDGSALACNGRALSDEVTLIEGPPPAPSPLPTAMTQGPDACVIAISADSKHDYRHAEMRVLASPSTQQPATYVWSKRQECRFGECAPCVAKIEPADPFRLQVRFASGDESFDDAGECWLKHKDGEPVPITVLKDSARLELRCVGCVKSERREIHLTTRSD